MTRLRRQKGSILLVASILFTVVLALVLASLTIASARVRDARASGNNMTGQFVAEAGLQREIQLLRSAASLASLSQPFAVIDALDTRTADGIFSQVLSNQLLLDGQGRTIGEYDVLIDVQDRASTMRRNVDVMSVAFIPTRSAVAAHDPTASRIAVRATVRLERASSEVFDYSYFINHWGWFFGNTITSNGSVRANGQFDFGGYRSTVNGSPRYESADGTDLIGYIDDNGDGLRDGKDGGIFAGFGIVRAAGVRGMGSLPQNRHAWETKIGMPNLSDLTWYENLAKSRGSSISLDGKRIASAVLGDAPNEAQHLCLIGTAEKPIVIDGPIVVRGSVIIGGVITGRGTIFAGGNVYIPRNLTYVNPPTTVRPPANDEASVEAWLRANQAKDSIGLFARENIVIGDFTNDAWGSYVSRWLNDPMNKSQEDAGLDGIQNTRDGPDGIAGTADDDVLEGDGAWTVSRYTDQDLALGLIPAGKSVGDVIPGSGEDIDGDGIRDGQITLAHVTALEDPFNPGLWEGNPPPHDPGEAPSGPVDSADFHKIDHGRAQHYEDIATVYVDRIDACLYTNHACAGFLVSPSKPIEFNGGLVSRNESIIYSAPGLRFNHDERLTGRTAEHFGMWLPVAWRELQIICWEIASPTVVDQISY